MIVSSPVASNVTVYYQTTTFNKSFLEMSDFLSKINIQNNKFFLILFDPDLYNVNPHDPAVAQNPLLSKKIAMECTINYWYFIRECIRIPKAGSTGDQFKLDRGNLALNYCIQRNMNVFLELPRQFGKTISIICRLLWEWQFGTQNSECAFFNKKHDDSKMNLRRLRDIRDALPEYLQMKEIYDENGKLIKETDRVETLKNPINQNIIHTIASARNAVAASNLGRGCTYARIWYDEFAFLGYNRDIFLSATPAFSTASENAKRHGVPYGILISTTPGDLTNDSGKYAYGFRENATKFSEDWYDKPDEYIRELLLQNTSSSFVHIKFTYQQLGAGEEYLAKMIREMQKDYPAIRREVLLEWACSSDNSPFSQHELDTVRKFIQQPVGKITLGNYYTFNIYNPMDIAANTVIIGVDVSGGFERDSSTITMIDSRTTKVIGDLNCNYIEPYKLAQIIVELVQVYCKGGAVVNVERNGGYGASVIGLLRKSPIKDCLYFEYKDIVTEERHDGFRVEKKKVNTRVFGLNSSKNVRLELMEILRERMSYHKDKFISPILMDELSTLEVKKNGRIEHSNDAHDDQIFAYLMALYVWYNGKDLYENWGIQKTALKTDIDESIEVVSFEEEAELICDKIKNNPVYDSESDVDRQMNYINSVNVYSPEQWVNKQVKEDEQYLNQLLSTHLGKEAYQRENNLTDAEINRMVKDRKVATNVNNFNQVFYDNIPYNDNNSINNVQFEFEGFNAVQDSFNSLLPNGNNKFTSISDYYNQMN